MEHLNQNKSKFYINSLIIFLLLATLLLFPCLTMRNDFQLAKGTDSEELELRPFDLNEMGIELDPETKGLLEEVINPTVENQHPMDPSLEEQTVTQKPLKTAAANQFKTKSKKTKTLKKSKKALNAKTTKKLAQIGKKLKFAPVCKEEFFGTRGLGRWGKFIKNQFAKGRFQELLQTNNKDFQKVCPGFRKMKREEKENLWVVILMSMSHYESSCRTSVEAQGPYGIAKGLLQLHEGSENIYVHWDQERFCKKGDSKNPKKSLQCTLSMLNGQVKKFGSIFFQGSYWDVLRNVQKNETHASKIRSAIQMVPGCKNVSLVSKEPSRKNRKSI